MVVALVFLLLLTMLAISATGNSLLQERMAGGLRNAQQAEMSAETALRGAEWKLWSSGSIGVHLRCGTETSSACYTFDPDHPISNVVKFRTQPDWFSAGATVYRGDGNAVDYTTLVNGKLARNPLYVIEDLGVELPPGVSGSLRESGATGVDTSAAAHVYRITARGSGGNGNTVRVLESTFAVKAN
ncbi:hypothetical protein B0E48_07325 [Rhodanobacter sp. C03]|nr:hypothetical protein B0E48_07325 [Rhodanobacter sp. C03]